MTKKNTIFNQYHELIDVCSPAPAWAHLNSTPEQGTVAVGEKRPIGFSFTPTEGNPTEGIYPFYLRVTSSNAPKADSLIYVAVTAEGIGNAIFKVQDIYTGTLDGSGKVVQGLAGARITVQNELVTTIESTLTTDALGEAFFQDLPAGRYKARITASNHQEHIGRIWIKPGITINESVFLDYNPVTVEWKVVETTIEDKYTIILNITYETNVPAAVVVAEPASVYLPNMQAGDVYQGEFTLSNYGLLRADNVRFILPDGGEYFIYELLTDLPESIPAKSKYSIPYRVLCLKSFDLNDGGGDEGCLRFAKCGSIPNTSICPSGVEVESSAPYCVLYDNGACASTPVTPPVPGGGSGGSGGWYISGTGGGSGGTPAPSPPPTVIEGVKCLPKADRDECSTDPKCGCPTPPGNDPHEATGSSVNMLLREYRDDSVDMFVKVLGGRLEVGRVYFADAWRFEHERHNLSLENVSGGLYGIVAQSGLRVATAGEAAPLPPRIPSRPSINKGGVIYEIVNETATPKVFAHETYRITETASGYLWTDKFGNWKSYDAEGLMLAWGSPAGIEGKILYDAEGTPVGLLDRKDRQLITFSYNSAGRLEAAEDTTGRRVEYGYTAGKLTSVKDVLGHTWTYKYDGSRLIRKTDPLGHSTFISYDSYGNVSKVVDDDGVGRFFTFDYDTGKNEFYVTARTSSGKFKEVYFDRDGDVKETLVNGRTVLKMTTDGRNWSVSDERGDITKYELDEWKNVTKITYPDGTSKSYEYDHALNKRTREVNELGVETMFSYDASGNLTEEIQAAGTADERIIRHTYDAEGNLTSTITVADERTARAETSFTHDDFGNVVTSTDPEGYVNRFTHDVMGNILTRLDPREKTWTFTYDDSGKIATAKDPMKHLTQVFYDAAGNLEREIDAEGKEKTFGYDWHNRLTKLTDTGGNSIFFEYNTDGKVRKKTDPEGKIVEFVYDNEERLTKTIDGNGNEIRFEYDDSAGCSSCAGKTSDPSRIIYPTFTREFSYDSRGRKTEERDILSATETLMTRYAYDGAGNLVRQTDREGRVTLYEYDNLNRAVATTDPSNHITRYAYDDRDNLISLTDANGHLTIMGYDRNNKMVSEKRPLGQETKYLYNGMGNLARRIDAKNQKNEYLYDDAMRLTGVNGYATAGSSSPVKSVSFTHDNLGHLTGYSDGETLGEYVYDDAYRMTLETVHYGPFSLSSTTTWYKNGQKQSFTGPDGVSYTYSYDAANQFASVDIPGTGSITYNNYQWMRPSSITYPGGSQRTMSYDPLMRLKSILVKDPGANPIMSYGYTFDMMDNIVSKETEHGVYGYAYDELYRLTQAQSPVRTPEAFGYDPSGNRLTSADVQGDWIYNENDELVSYGNVVFSYDANGNTIEKYVGTTLTRNIYDTNNRLVRVEDGLSGIIATYGYDPFGRRLWKEVSGVRTYFFYSAEGIIGEYDSSGAQSKAYGYRPGSMYGTEPLFMREGTAYYFYQTDHLGTPVLMITGNGFVASSAQYDVFGSAVLLPGSTTLSNFRFPGQQYDEETGMHYNLHRYYDPTTGRYLTPDPVRLAGGINQYVYCGVDPVNGIDHLGLARYVIIVGDPGLGHHSAGTNFERAADTRANQLRQAGHTVDVLRASNVTDFNNHISSGNIIDGGVIYYGHGWNGALYIGETPDPGTNLDSSNISILSNSNIGASATIELNACNSGAGGDNSISKLVATQLDRRTSGWDRPLGFTGVRGHYLHGTDSKPPETGPLYVVPTPGGQLIPYNP